MQKIILLFMFFISFNCQAATTADTMKNLLPQKCSGWEATDEDGFYVNDELYGYIDGGAEVFLSYSYKGVLNRNYTRKNFANISVDIFDMGTSYNAFGVYSHTRDKDDNLVGQGSQSFTGALIFWKDKYYVSVTTSSNNTEVNAALKEIALKIAAAIPADGELPEILKLLPESHMVPDGYVWFHHYIWQNSYYFISNDNILNINDSVEAVQAKCGPQNARYYLFIIKYPTEKECLAAINSFAHFYNTTIDSMILGEVGMPDSSKILFTTKDEYFLAVLNIKELETGVKLINNVIAKKNP
jgi:hypothetical protein